MDFYKVLKYVLAVLFLLVIGVAALNTESNTPTQVQQPASTQSQSKFNF